LPASGRHYQVFVHVRRVAGQRPALPGLRPRALGCRPAAGTTRRQACS